MRQLQLVFWGCFYLLFFLNGFVMGGTSSLAFPLSLETAYTVIQYRSLEDLEAFDDEIDYNEEGVFGRLFSGSDVDDPEGKVKSKVDALFRRVQEILDMRKTMKKVTIKIYSNRKETEQAYTEIYGRRSSAKGVLRAWFRDKNNTIYINLEDLHAGMLAHEMAHAVINNYFVIRAPEATDEILSRYVDSHLYD